MDHDPAPGTAPRLVAVGAGFGRTGTRSMKLALEQLGLGPTHHMFEAFERPEHFPEWTAAVRGASWDRGRVLEGYRSTVDFPSSIVWEELWRANPGSTVVLTTRSSDSWWRSFDATIADGLRVRDDVSDEGAHRPLFAAIDQVVFGGRSEDRSVAVAAFEAHQQRVLDLVPPDQLVRHELGDGWGPLCEHFGLAVPDEPYPSVNSTEEFLAGRD